MDRTNGMGRFTPREIGARAGALAGYLREGVWRVKLSGMPPKRAFLIRQLRVVLLTLRGFVEDRCQLRASALTFYSLLAIVPVLALGFAIAKGFGLRQRMRAEVLKTFSGQEEIIGRAMDFADSLIENASGGAIAGVGVVVLLWSVIKVLGHIEKSFNDIWEVRKERPMGRRITNYLSIMLISPIILILSGSATVFISAQVEFIMEELAVVGVILGPVVFLTLKVLPFLLMWLLLAFVYITVPNRKVRLAPGFTAAVVAGSIYQLLQWVYINFQIGIARQNAIYGSFAALPLFLIWLQLSWLVILFGAEYSYSQQNVDAYEFEPDYRNLSPSFRKVLWLRLTHLVIQHFSMGKAPLTAERISAILETPLRLTNDLLAGLVEAGVVLEVTDDATGELGYLPARDPDTLTIGYVIDALEDRGTGGIPVKETRPLVEISETLQAFRETVEGSEQNRLLKDI